MGHLAADVDFRQTQSGKTLATFPIATNRRVKDETGEYREIVDFHRVVAWGRLGEICHEFLVKGLAVYLEGRLVNRSFEGKNGEKRYRTEIIAESLNILTWKKKKGKDEIGIEPISDLNIDESEEFEHEKDPVLV
jgi:single-strand DNA-binding protein